MNTTTLRARARVRNVLALSAGLFTCLLAGAAGAGEIVNYVLTDHLGSPAIVQDASRVIVKQEVFDPYGDATLSPNDSGIGYTGHMSDGATGLVYMQARYYDPEIGWFLSVDPVTFSADKPQQFNRYWYANGNPYLNVDPDGREVSFATGTPNSIRNAYSNMVSGSATAGSMFRNLEKSTTTYTVKEGIVSQYVSNEKTIYIAQDGGKGLRGKYWRFLSFASEDEKVSIDGTDQPISLEEKLAHEGSHAYDDDLGRSLTEDKDSDGLEDTEERAVKTTNQVREEMGIEGRRDSYDGIEVK